jgi:predicted dehydrogenase
MDLHLVFPDANRKPVMDERANFDPTQCGGHDSYQWEQFIAAIDGKPLANATPPEQIVDGIRIIEAMARSEQSGQPEAVK